MSERTFQPDTAEVVHARRFVARTLAPHVSPDLVEDAVLLTSELVANALLHTGSAATVRVEVDGETVRVAICDDSPVPPVRKRYGPGATTGRGLLLVEQLASAWGVDPEPGGKAVWFVLGRRDRTDPDGTDQRSTPATGHDLDELDLDALAAAFGEHEPTTDAEPGNRLVSR